MTLKEKLDKITSPNKSNWLKEAIEKQATVGARRNSWKVALRVLSILDERGMSQTELAEKMGVSRQQVTKIVKGQENFTFETIDKLEKALGVTLITVAFPEKSPEYNKPVRATTQKKGK
jgi:ribosome-binding protein aMBF1 (putative translation factor)